MTLAVVADGDGELAATPAEICVVGAVTRDAGPRTERDFERGGLAGDVRGDVGFARRASAALLPMPLQSVIAVPG